MPAQATPTEKTVLVQIEKLIQGGKGLAHEGALAIFVEGVLPGEDVRIELGRVRKGYAEGRLLESYGVAYRALARLGQIVLHAREGERQPAPECMFRIETGAVVHEVREAAVGDRRHQREDADRHQQLEKRESAEKFIVYFPRP